MHCLATPSAVTPVLSKACTSARWISPGLESLSSERASLGEDGEGPQGTTWRVPPKPRGRLGRLANMGSARIEGRRGGKAAGATAEAPSPLSLDGVASPLLGLCILGLCVAEMIASELDSFAVSPRERSRGFGPRFLRGMSYLHAVSEDRQLLHRGLAASHLILRCRQASHAELINFPIWKFHGAAPA